MEEIFKQAISDIMSQREEILRAFVAKHGIDDPERAMQVVQTLPNGSVTWSVCRLTDEMYEQRLKDLACTTEKEET